MFTMFVTYSDTSWDVKEFGLYELVHTINCAKEEDAIFIRITKNKKIIYKWSIDVA